MQPSRYQEAIYEWVRNGSGNAFVNAVAGSGKTTTALAAAALLPKESSARFVAFNKSVAEELNQRLSGPMTASTVHSLGFAALRGARCKLDSTKYRNLVYDYLDRCPLPVERQDNLRTRAARMVAEADNREERKALATPILALIDKCRVTLTPPKDTGKMARLVSHFGIELAPEHQEYVFRAVRELLQTRVKDTMGIVDFTDMIFLPVVDTSVQLQQFDWLFVDEAQDLSACQFALLQDSVKSTGRMLFVGDPKQAIYGFAGADAESVDRIIRETEATVLPLSVCYRCPSSHLDWARTIVPQIEAREGAPQGEIHRIDGDTLPSRVAVGDLVICRFNAPLVSMCFALLGEGIPARMKGRDIGRALVQFLERVQKTAGEKLTSENMQSLVEKATEELVAKMIAKGADPEDGAVVGVRDQAASAIAIWFGRDCKSVLDFEKAIAALFADETTGVVELSSIHRAKGLESERVFLLQPDRMPRRCRSEWEQEQEENLLYVALTRAKRELFLVFDRGAELRGTSDEFNDMLAQQTVPEQDRAVAEACAKEPAPVATEDAVTEGRRRDHKGRFC